MAPPSHAPSRPSGPSFSSSSYSTKRSRKDLAPTSPISDYARPGGIPTSPAYSPLYSPTVGTVGYDPTTAVSSPGYIPQSPGYEPTSPIYTPTSPHVPTAAYIPHSDVSPAASPAPSPSAGEAEAGRALASPFIQADGGESPGYAVTSPSYTPHFVGDESPDGGGGLGSGDGPADLGLPGQPSGLFEESSDDEDPETSPGGLSARLPLAGGDALPGAPGPPSPMDEDDDDDDDL